MKSSHIDISVIAVWAASALAVFVIHGSAITLFTPTWAVVLMTVAVVAGAVIASWQLTRSRSPIQ